MKALAKLGAVVLVTLAGVNSTAEPSEADFEQIGQYLRQYARELSDVGNAMRVLASTKIPEGLNETEKRSLAAKRRELLATADVALKLVIQIERREAKAQRMTLTRVDMERLGVDSDALARRVNRSLAGAPKRIAMRSAGLNETIKETESMQETLRNKRQTTVTAFQNFDQKWNQLFNMLTTVLKNKKDLEAGVTRNML